MGKTLPICGFIFVLATLVHGKGDMQQGCINCQGDKLLLHEIAEHSAKSIVKSHTSRVYPSMSSGHVIKGISVVDVQGDGESYIKEGGIGQSTVAIEMRGLTGNGFHFIVDVYVGPK